MGGMRASRTLPDGYVAAGGVTLANNRRLMILLNVIGVPWMAVCAVFFAVLAGAIRPQGLTLQLDSATPAGLFGGLIGGLVLLASVLVLHEAAHGLFFWLFTRARPVFGFKGWYAYAAAPGWHLSRGRFLAVLLAPFVALPVVGLPLVAFGPPVVVIFTLLALIVNATSAIGDLYMCVRLLRLPRAAVVEDRHDGITWYLAAVPHPHPVP